MSCDIYLACERHKSCIWIGQTGMSGFTFYSGEPKCMSALGRWLRDHYLCDPAPKISTEYVCDEDDGWQRAEWKDT